MLGYTHLLRISELILAFVGNTTNEDAEGKMLKTTVGDR